MRLHGCCDVLVSSRISSWLIIVLDKRISNAEGGCGDIIIEVDNHHVIVRPWSGP